MPTRDASGALTFRGGSMGAAETTEEGAGEGVGAEEEEVGVEAEGGRGGSLKMISWTRFRMR